MTETRPAYVERKIPWFSKLWPSAYYNPVKWFVQRGSRGWADRDVWSVDQYLARIIPEMLERLKSRKNSIPPILHDLQGNVIYEMTSETSDETFENARRLWNHRLDEIIEAFRVYQTADEWGYEPGLSNEEVTQRITAHTAKMEANKKKMHLLIQDFDSLWD